MGNCCPLTQNKAMKRWEVVVSSRETPQENPTGLNGRHVDSQRTGCAVMSWEGREGLWLLSHV